MVRMEYMQLLIMPKTKEVEGPETVSYVHERTPFPPKGEPASFTRGEEAFPRGRNVVTVEDKVGASTVIEE